MIVVSHKVGDEPREQTIARRTGYSYERKAQHEMRRLDKLIRDIDKALR